MNKSVFLSNIHHAFAQTDGTYSFPNSLLGDLIKTAKREIETLEKENQKLRKSLENISITAHCIAMSGPSSTPTLQDAWSKFMKINATAINALNEKNT